MPSATPDHILVTGGAGFIGSHAALRLLEAGHRVTIVDNLSRGHRAAIQALERVAPDRLRFVEADLRATGPLTAALRGVDLVLHFAALAYVGESVDQPLRYYRTNIESTLSLLEAMDAAEVDCVVLSSTCATYGEPPDEAIPIRESCPQSPVNPYGRSKLACEAIIRDWRVARRRAGRAASAAFLRYFNVAGSDRSGRVGEVHRPETHLIPICLEVALGQRDRLSIFGDDWPTPDGTCIRDYVHVEDLVDAHLVVARDIYGRRSAPGELADERIFNIGTGQGVSVREVLDACRRVTGHAIPASVAPRRAGDPPRLIGSPECIKSLLGWEARHRSIEGMVEDAWRWRRAHPQGW
jgi:UDP-glucose-4-epimerase GalE